MTKEEFEARLKKAVEGCKTKVDVIAAISREFHDLNINYAPASGTKATAYFNNLFRDKKLVKANLEREDLAEVSSTFTKNTIVGEIIVNAQVTKCPALTHLCFYSYQIRVKKTPNYYELKRIELREAQKNNSSH